jgi:broad specificity phosphatase PhoE
VALDDPRGAADRETLAAGRAALAGVESGAVWSSPALRARQTAAHFEFYAPTILPELAELDFGQFEGRLWSELEAAHPGGWRHAPQELPLGEPFSAFVARVAACRHVPPSEPEGRCLPLATAHGPAACAVCTKDTTPPRWQGRGISNGALLRLAPQPRFAPSAP